MSESQAVVGTQEMNWFWKELGADVSDTLTASQRTAIEQVVKKSTAQAQPADVRLHLGKYYVRIIAGKADITRLRDDDRPGAPAGEDSWATVRGPGDRDRSPSPIWPGYLRLFTD